MNKNFLDRNLLYLIFGLIFTIYIFYIRILLVRLPKELILFNPTKYSLWIIAIIWISLSIFIISKSIKNLLDIPSKETYLQKILGKVHKFIDDSLIHLYRVLLNLFPETYNLYNKGSKITKKFYDTFGYKHEGLLFFISYTCRFIIVFCFFVDVFILFELRYFYKALFLLCITIIINIFVYFLKDFSENLSEIETLLIIKHLNENEIQDEPIYSFKPTPGNEDINLAYTIQEFYLCSKISGYLKAYDFYVNYYSTYFNLIIYSIYLIGWLYVILYNIFLYL